MRDVLFVIGCALFALGILALFVYVMLRDLHRLYLLFTGRVPMYRIARFVIFGFVGFVVLAPVIVFMESKSPLHLVVKPAAEESCSRECVCARVDWGADVIWLGTKFC
jgi:hypothetical protein